MRLDLCRCKGKKKAELDLCLGQLAGSNKKTECFTINEKGQIHGGGTLCK